MDAVVELPVSDVWGRVRTAAASQGWVMSTGGLPAMPEEPMAFHRGFGSMQPGWQLIVQLFALSPTSTKVVVREWRGPTPVDGYDAQRMLRAIAPA